MSKTPMPTAKDRINPMQVYVNARERAAIKANAKAAGMTASRYLCAVGMGAHLRSSTDHEAVAALAKIHADEGRLGGLLRAWGPQGQSCAYTGHPGCS